MVAPTEDEIEAGLLYSQWYWTTANLTFSVPTAGSTWTGYPNPFNGNNEPGNAAYAVLNATQATQFRLAMSIWDSYIDPEITEVVEPAGVGNIRAAFTDVEDYNGNAWGYAYTPQQPPFSPEPVNGDIWIDDDYLASTFAVGSYDFEALLHEIGHALGLKHSFEGASQIPDEYDTRRYTIMSYTNPEDSVYRTFSGGGGSISSSGAVVNPSTPMVFDIVAIQARYGADPNTATGNNIYSWNQMNPVFEAIYDAGGTDTFDLSAHTRASIVDLTPGAYSSIAQWSVAEQTAYYQSLYDPFFASFIADWLDNEDTYTWTDNIGIAYTTTIENVLAGSGNDTITGNAAANAITGNAGDDTIHGKSGNDTLNGNDGNDTLTGAAGVDTISGGIGNDTINGGDHADAINGGDGIDTATYAGATAAVTVRLDATASGNWATGDVLTSIENLIGGSFNDVLGGDAGVNSLDGSVGDDSLSGRAGDDVLLGSFGNDALVGGGGNDTLDGGTGNDSLNGGANADGLIGGDGNDTAVYSASLIAVLVSLTEGTASGGDANGDTFSSIESLVGSAFNDSLTGSSGVNRLEGGAGADFINGRSGDDALFGGDDADKITGSTGNDSLSGDAGDDELTGGEGADSLNGGLGIDVALYGGSTVAITIDLQANTGSGGEAAGDTFSGVENVTGTLYNDTLSGDANANRLEGGSGDDTLVGRDGADVLRGKAGNDRMNGGTGNDTLTGGGGQDEFVFASALGASNVDDVTDFDVPNDTIRLENAIFTGLAAGTLAAGAFRIGAAAADADDRIIYNSATGTLSWDADGNGAGAAVVFATLDPGLALTNADFVVF